MRTSKENAGGSQMLSEQRVMHMTKMAMIEDKQGRKLGPAIHCTLGGVFLGTLIYAALYAGLIVLLASTLVVNIHLVGLILGILLGLVLYILYMYYYLRMVRRHAAKRYDEGVTLLRHLRKDYRELREMYQEEDLSKIPEGWD